VRSRLRRRRTRSNNPVFSSVIGLGCFKAEYGPKAGPGRKALAIGVLLALGAAGVIGIVVYAYYIYTTWGASRLDNELPVFFIFGLMALGGGAAGLWQAWRAFSDRGLVVGLYEQGVAEHVANSVRQMRWEQADAIFQNVTRHYYNGIYTGTTHVYTVVSRDRQKFVFDDRLKDVEQLGNQLQQSISNFLYPAYVTALNTGQKVQFGPLALDRERLYAGNKSLAWSEIKAIKLQAGQIQVKQEGGWFNWSTASVPQIPNFFVFYQLIRTFATVE
jgi:hypothetical protein